MALVGSAVRGRETRSCRYQTASGFRRAAGVAPSPSRFDREGPERPSAQGQPASPQITRPRRRSPGERNTRISRAILCFTVVRDFNPCRVSSYRERMRNLASGRDCDAPSLRAAGLPAA